MAKREMFKDFKEARAAAEKLSKDNPGRIYFIMSKDGYYTVITGWDGRDEALKDGWRF